MRQDIGFFEALKRAMEELRDAADQADTEYRAEIERLRLAIRRLADQDATLSVQGGDVIVEMDAALTDDETDLLLWLSSAGEEERVTSKTITPAGRATLRGLLERTTRSCAPSCAPSCALTDAEREAVEWAAEAARDRASVWTTGDQLGLGCGSIVAAHGDTLRGLLERMR